MGVVVVATKCPWAVRFVAGAAPLRDRGGGRVLPLRSVDATPRLHQERRARHDDAAVAHQPGRPAPVHLGEAPDDLSDSGDELLVALTARRERSYPVGPGMTAIAGSVLVVGHPLALARASLAELVHRPYRDGDAFGDDLGRLDGPAHGARQHQVRVKGGLLSEPMTK